MKLKLSLIYTSDKLQEFSTMLDSPNNKQQPFILTRLFSSVLGLTSPMAFPQHSPPPSPVPSIFPTKSLLSHIFFQHFSPSLPGPTFHSITIYLQCPQFSLSNTTHLSYQHDPNHLNLFCCMTSATSSIAIMFLTHSLLLLSLKLTPVIHLNIFISLLCIFLISSIFVGHVSLPYNIAGLMHVV